MTCQITVPWPVIEPGPTAVKERSLNHWTTREFPSFPFLYVNVPPFPPKILAATDICRWDVTCPWVPILSLESLQVNRVSYHVKLCVRHKTLLLLCRKRCSRKKKDRGSTKRFGKDSNNTPNPPSWYSLC